MHVVKSSLRATLSSSLFFLLLPLGSSGCGSGHLQPVFQIKNPDIIEIRAGGASFSFKLTSQVVIEGEGVSNPLQLELSPLSEEMLKITPSFSPAGSGRVRVRGVTVLLKPMENVDIKRAYHEGFQSWSPAYVWSGRSFAPLMNFDLSSGELPIMTQHPYFSWWVAGWEGDEVSLVFGAVESHVFKTRILLSENGELTAIQGQGQGEVKEVEGKTFYFEPLVLTTGRTLEKALRLYGEALSEADGKLTAPYVPVGWNSWNTFFENITSGILLESAEKIKTLFPGSTTPVIQIDDGWEPRWGIWKPKTEFLAGIPSLEEFVRRITEGGMRAGIWTAPFLYDASLTLPNENPEMFVKDEQGKFLLYHHGDGSTYAVIDPTSPSGEEFLRNTFSRLHQSGFTYFKIDYLFAPLLGTTFYDGSTPVEAYRKGLKIIGEEVGPHSYILACGAPLLPTAGLAHGIRLGPDIALANFPYGWHMVKNEFRNIFFRFFWNSIFDGDPDTVLLRKLTESESRLFLYASLFAGKIFALGDDLINLEPEKLSLIRGFLALPQFEIFTSPGKNIIFTQSVLPPSKNPPADVITGSFFPSLYRVPEVAVRKLNENAWLLGLFNWENFRAQINLSLYHLTGSKGPWTLKNALTGEELKTSDLIERKLDPHTAELWTLSRL